VTSSQGGIGIVYVEQVELQVESQTPGILGIDLQLFDGGDVTSLDVEQLVVDHSLEQFEVDPTRRLSVFEQRRDWFPRLVVWLADEVIDGGPPPVQARLAN